MTNSFSYITPDPHEHTIHIGCGLTDADILSIHVPLKPSWSTYDLPVTFTATNEDSEEVFTLYANMRTLTDLRDTLSTIIDQAEEARPS